ncbi:MAG TPA: DUF3857 domain-containing protein [Polyangiaceae bacterium]
MRRRLALLVPLLLGACRHTPEASYPPLASVKRVASDDASVVDVSLFRAEYRFNADGTYTSTVHDTYKVLAQDAVDAWGATEASWAPWHMERPSIEATVTSADGKVSHLEPGALSEAAAYPEAPEMYGDEKVLRGPLPNVGVGSVVDETTVTKTNRPFVGGAEAHTINFQVGVPRTKVELVLDMPESMPIHFEVRDAQVKTTDVRSGGRRVVTFSGGPYGAIKDVEENEPSNVVEWPHVGFTTGTDWASIAKTYAKLVAEKSAGANLDGAVAGVVKSSDAPVDKAQKLLAWLRDRVRYVGIEFGESGIVPRGPTETLKNGYGDCKDQAVLLVALLRAAGMPARVALVDAGYGEDIDASLPALNVFDHAIVVVPGKDAIWIDPTSTRARAGEIPAQDQNRYALVVDEGTTGLVRTPGPSDTLNTYREIRQVFLPPEGGARILETSSATGSLERGMRDAFDVSTKDKDKWLKDYVAKTYDSAEPGALQMEKVEDLSAQFRMVVEAKNAQISTSSLLSSTVNATPSPIFSWIPRALSDGDDRQTPFALGVPYQAEIVYEIHPPAGFVLDDESKPDVTDVPMGPAMLTRKLERRSDGVVVARYRFVLPKALWTADEVNAFRRAYETYGSTSVPVLSFEHQGQKLHKAREFEKELDAYRRDVQAQPDQAAPKMRLAQALLELGFGTTARKLADDATRIAPDDLELWNYAGYIRLTDPLGRWHKAGWDREGAIAAFRQSLRVDPTSIYAATQLAAIYEYNPAGHRYQAGSNLEDAAKILDGLDPEKLAAYEKGDWMYNALFDLTYAGHFDEVHARIAKMDAKKAPMIPAIVSAGMLKGANAALSEAERLSTPGSQRATVLEGAADIFIALRRYPEATTMLSAAAAGSSDANLRHRVEVIGKSRPVDPVKLPVARPEDVVRKVLAICTLRAPSMKDDLKAVVSKRDTDPSGDSLFAAFCDGMGISPSNAQDVPREALADIVAAQMDFKTEGSDALGYRVGVTMGESKFSFFVVREGSAYQLRTTSFSPPDMGCEALTMQRAGRKVAAAKWLTWARELVTPSGGDDPLRDAPFLGIWTDEKGDVELAAAALCAARGRSDLTASTLNAARAKASGDRLTAIDHAMALSYAGNGHEADLLTAATQLRKDVPTSESAWLLERGALAGLGRFQQLRDESAAWLAKAPNDPQRLWDLADAEDRLGHFKEAHAVGERWIATGKGGAWAYNQQAWRSLYLGPTEKDLEYALKAVNAEPGEAKYLNTLAAVDIALGHTADAHERFEKSLELRKDETPTDGDWYVLGRIAEQLGLPDEAKAAYAKVSAGNKAHGQYTIARLAQARMHGR